jgi:hypothetical protein
MLAKPSVMYDRHMKNRQNYTRVGIAILPLFLACHLTAIAGTADQLEPQTKNFNPEQKAQLEQKLESIKATFPNFPVGNHKHSIPVNFPLPVYSSNVLSTNFTATTKGPPRAKAIILTSDSPSTAINWYQAECRRANWDTRVPNAAAAAKLQKHGPDYMLDAQRGREEVVIECSRPTNQTSTLISINWILKSKHR